MRIIEKQFLIAGYVTVAAVAIGVFILVRANRESDSATFPLLAMVFVAGCIGGTTNHYRRLQSVPGTDEQLRAVARPSSLVLQAVVSPILGGIFAVIAYLIFAGALLGEGGLFPSFSRTKDDYVAVKGFLDIGPKTNGDVAKMLVWAFLAGFSERFVPNLLDRLSRDVDDDSHRPGSGAAA